ncbi:MAG: GTPase HflX, partial [Clostridiales bacterium]|nr:GTPase HflX [Clostridiales bacterium]
MTEIHITEEKKNSTAVLVGVETPEMRDGECEASLDELERLAETAGAVVAARLVQSREKPDVRTVIGSGKVAELKTICSECGAELCIFDCEMSPSQIRNVEDEVGEVRVIDRSMLILDIFALHAATAEGKLQVELAQLKYTAPRLIGKGKQLSRLGGGIGTRGPGESKLESDKRHLARRVAALETELEAVENTRRTTRSARDRSGLPRVAIVGYTNAGKSTLLNRLTDAG